jgi:FkbM family methyltransferase
MSSPRSNVLVGTDFGQLIVNINDSPIGSDIFGLGYHLKNDIDIMISLIRYLVDKRSDVIVYDIGANIGLHTLAFASSFREKIMLRGFEAQRQLYYMLCGSVALNNFSNVFCHHYAVSDVSGESLTFSTPDYSKHANFGSLELIPPRLSDNQSMQKVLNESVSTIKLDDFDEAVDFIKMDIEGMEDKALRGAVKTIERNRPIAVVEIGKTDYDFVLNFFRNLNYIGLHKGADLIAIPLELNLTVQGLSRFF